MIQSLSIRFYLNHHKAKGDKMPVYLRITLNRKKAEAATSYLLEQKEWNEDNQRTKKNTAINQHLSDIENKVYDIVRQLEREKKPLTATIIKDYLLNKNKLNATLLEYYDNYLSRIIQAGELQLDSIQRYRDTLGHLKNFLEIKKLDDVPLERMDYRLVSDFDLYLVKQQVNREGKLLTRNTANKHHNRLRTILIRALKEGQIQKNPYWDFKLRNNPTSRAFLTHEEIEKLNEHDLGENESLKRVRDIFIFSVYTGLRFEDAQKLTIDRIIKDKKGNYFLQIEQEKTNESVSIPLFAPAIRIINKYDGKERKITGCVLPKISNQKLNAYLKVIANLVEIKKSLTHHVARHTCATTILLSNEIPIEAVSKWLGHTNIKTTQIYAKITNNYLQKMAEKIENKIPDTPTIKLKSRRQKIKHE